MKNIPVKYVISFNPILNVFKDLYLQSELIFVNAIRFYRLVSDLVVFVGFPHIVSEVMLRPLLMGNRNNDNVVTNDVSLNFNSVLPGCVFKPPSILLQGPVHQRNVGPRCGNIGDSYQNMSTLSREESSLLNCDW